MAINAATVWEIRTTGSQTNGGGFYNRNPGTSVDYSQQDAAQLSLSDIATDGAGTGVSSATGGFTAAMVGNIIYLTGGSSTPGWYEITAYADTNNVTIDRSAGATKSSVTGNVGGAFKIGGTLDSDFFASGQKAAGNTVHIKSGTYTAGENISMNTQTGMSYAAPMFILGYNATRNDNPIGDNRPLINMAAYSLTPPQYIAMLNVRFTGTAAGVCYLNAYNYFYNCKSTNTSATASRTAFDTSNNVVYMVKCEGISTKGTAFAITSNQSVVLFCSAHDSVNGIQAAIIVGCVVYNCSTAGGSIGTNTMLILNSVSYNCGTGFPQASNYPLVVSNVISGCTTGMSASAERGIRTLMNKNNCLYNTTDLSNITLDASNLLATNPLLNNPAAGDFTLQAGSPCLDAGMQPDSMIGL